MGASSTSMIWWWTRSAAPAASACALLAQLEEKARRAGCVVLDLDSGTERERAHRFYFRAGYTIRTFGFKKTL